MIAKYPPMGWNSWDCYGAAVTEDTVRKNADYMAKYMKPYGHINTDIVLTNLQQLPVIALIASSMAMTQILQDVQDM